MNFEEIFNQSYQRNVQNQRNLFFSRFYEKFVNSSESVKEAFRDTDMERQKSMLEDSLKHIIAFSSTKTTNSFLEALAIVHKKANNIQDNMYDLWLDAIIATIEEIDSQYTNQDGLAWKITLSPGMEFMKGFPQK